MVKGVKQMNKALAELDNAIKCARLQEDQALACTVEWLEMIQESIQEALEEVEQLKWDIRGLKYRQEVHKDFANQIHKQLQDALNTLEAIANHPDGDPTDEMLQVKWDAQQAVQRIQEGIE